VANGENASRELGDEQLRIERVCRETSPLRLLGSDSIAVTERKSTQVFEIVDGWRKKNGGAWARQRPWPEKIGFRDARRVKFDIYTQLA
jgi:hypothetical protein